MKKASIYLLLLTLPLFFAVSCKKSDTLKEVVLKVDVQSSFNNDRVVVFIDNQKQFDNAVTTNDVLSFAGGFSTTISEGRHKFQVFINSTSYTEEFSLNNTHYIRIRYERLTNRLSTIHSNQPFIYD